MNKQIKFRGKDNGNGEWVYGDLITGKYPVFPKLSIPLILDEFGAWEVTPETVGQFTGLTDRNGREIYEGDIVRWIDSDRNKRIDTVGWKNGGMILCNEQYTVGVYLFNDLEITGNIHDTPELLKTE